MLVFERKDNGSETCALIADAIYRWSSVGTTTADGRRTRKGTDLGEKKTSFRNLRSFSRSKYPGLARPESADVLLRPNDEGISSCMSLIILLRRVSGMTVL